MRGTLASNSFPITLGAFFLWAHGASPALARRALC